METIIFIVIALVISYLQNRAEKAKKRSQQQREAPPSYSPEESEDLDDDSEDIEEEAPPPEHRPSAARKLQEYIRQFEAAQREAAQGTMEPPTPPSIPEPTHRVGNNVPMREVAENIVQLDVVDAEYLMDEFEMSEGTAIAMLVELQKHRIVGRDMGDGEYDVLVHDSSELRNLLEREQKAKETAAATAPAEVASYKASDKQSQLKILEERARKAREAAAAAARQSDIENGYTGEALESDSRLTQRPAVRSISRESVRRGFIWAKIIDEPRFKKRWSPARR